MDGVGGEVGDMRAERHSASGRDFAFVGDGDEEGEGVVVMKNEVGEVDTVVFGGEGDGRVGAVEFDAYGGVFDGSDGRVVEEEAAIGEAEREGGVGIGERDKNGQGLGLLAVEFYCFGAGGCEKQGCEDWDYC